MDRRELLGATLKGEDTERIPCGFWHHFPEHQKFGNASVQAHVDFFNAIDADMIKAMNEHMYQLDRQIEKPEDWKSISSQTFKQSPYPAFLDEVISIKRALPADVPIIATIHGVLVSAYHATETPGNFSNPNNLVSRHLKADPECVAVGLQTIADTLIGVCEELKKCGVDGIYYAALGGESYRFTPQVLSSYVVPFDQQVIQAINDLNLISILHICKDQVQLPAYAGIPADIVNWAIHDCQYSLKDGRSLFPQATLLGGFDDRSGVLLEGSISEIETEVDSIVSEAGKKKLLLGADCTLPDDVETWRLCAVRNRAKLY